MSFSELLFVLLMVCLLVGIAVVAHMVGTANRRAEAQARELAEVRAQLALGNQERGSSSAEVREVRVGLEGGRAAVSARPQGGGGARQRLRRLEAGERGRAAPRAAGRERPRG